MASTSRHLRRRRCAPRLRRLCFEECEFRRLLAVSPSGSDNTITLLEDTSYVLAASDFGFSDSGDAPADLFVGVKITSLPTFGSLRIDNSPLSAGQVLGITNFDSRRITFVPAANANGNAYARLTFQVQDSGSTTSGGSNLDPTPNTLTFNVTPVDDPPVAFSRSYTGLACDGYLAISVGPGVTQFASEPDGEPVTLEIVTPPLTGTLSFQASGMFTYNRPAGGGFSGFTFRAFDGHSYSNVATISFTPQGPNCPPQAVNETYVTVQSSVLDIKTPQGPNAIGRGVLANDYDVDGTTAVAQLVSGPSHQQSFVLNTDGSFAYLPAPGFFGTDTFTYVGLDWNYHSSAPNGTVTIIVAQTNQPPVAANDSFTIAAGGTLDVPAPGVLANDGDIDSTTLTAVLVSPPDHGTLIFRADGSFSYTAPTNFTQAEIFRYQVRDGQLPGNVATVTLTPNVVNSPPVAVNDAYSVNQYAHLLVSTAGGLGKGVLVNDTAAAGVSVTAQLIAAPLNGTMALNPDGSFTYTPAPTFYGTDRFIYQLRENGNPTSVSNYGTATINVQHVNKPPVAVDDVFYPPGCSGSPYFAAAPGVLANDIDVDGDKLTVTIETQPTSGEVALNSDGSFILVGLFNSFTYRVSDGISSSVGTVRWGNPPPGGCTPLIKPTAGDDIYGGGPLVSVPAPGVLSNDREFYGNTLTAVMFTPPTHGTARLNADGSFLYVPVAGYSGPDSFRYLARAGDLGSNLATVSVTTTAGNHAPLVQSSTYQTWINTPLSVTVPGVLKGARDPDNDPFTASVATGPTHGTLSLAADGSFLYTPDAGYTGPDGFTFSASDGQPGVWATATVAIAVLPANHAPTGASATVLLLEDTLYTFKATDFGFGDTADTPANRLQAVKITTLPTAGMLVNGTALVVAGQLITTQDIAAGKLKFVPDTDGNGSSYATFTFQVQDDGGTAGGGVDLDPVPRTLSISVTPVNDPPQGQFRTLSVFPATARTFTETDFAFSDPADRPRNALAAVQIMSLPTLGTLTINGVAVGYGTQASVADLRAGKLVYTPPANANVTTQFGFRLRDDGGTALGGSDLDFTTRQLTLVTIDAPNTAPSGGDRSVISLENYVYSFTAGDFGFDDATDYLPGNFRAVKVASLPVAGALKLAGTPVTAEQFISTIHLHFRHRRGPSAVFSADRH
jgi:large repetitive protein